MFAPSCRPTMPDLNHTKSLLYYKGILESYEEQYRDATPDEREKVIDKISGEIELEANGVGAKIAPQETRRGVSISLLGVVTLLTARTSEQQIANFYSNHRSVPKEDEGPPVQVGKPWSARLVVNYLLRDEIEKRVDALGQFDPHVRITKWVSTVSQMMAELSPEELKKYQVLAEEWRKLGPPKELQRK